MLDWLACNGVRLLGAVLCALPPSFAISLGQVLGRLAMWLQPKRKRLAAANLRAAFDGALQPQAVDRIVKQGFEQLGAGVPELLRLPVIDEAYVDRYVTLEGRRYFDEANASGRPVIILTGHFGNWELTSIVSAIKGYPVVALAREQKKFPRLYRMLLSYREAKGNRIVHKGNALKLLIMALKQGKRIGIVGDQASRQGVYADFFGRPALFAVGPFDLAHTYCALIVPIFIHRTRGPFHRLVIEKPIDLSLASSKKEAIQDGAEQFAAYLKQHIQEDPGQWLWMHNRWKYTPNRRVVILSDQKAGHVKQSQALVQIMREQCPSLTVRTLDVQYRSGLSRALCLLAAAWLPGSWGARHIIEWALEPACARALLSQQSDVVVSCGAITAPVNRLWSSWIRAKSVVIMDPSPIPISRFKWVLAPRHDRLKQKANLIQTIGALTVIKEEDLQRAAVRLPLHQRYRPSANGERAHPVLSLFIGGDTDDYRIDAAFVDALLQAVIQACEASDAWLMVTTSRRTSPEAEAKLAERLETSTRCRLFVRASCDPLQGTMDGLLGAATVAVVTGESISMVSEACASGRSVLAVEPPLRNARKGMTKHRWFLNDLERQGWLKVRTTQTLAQDTVAAIQNKPNAARTDPMPAIREAVVGLLK